MEYADQMAYPQPGVEAYAQMAAPDPSVYAQAAAMATPVEYTAPVVTAEVVAPEPVVAAAEPVAAAEVAPMTMPEMPPPTAATIAAAQATVDAQQVPPVEESEGIKLFLSSRSPTGYRGVRKERLRYRAEVWSRGKHRNLGTFGSAVDAAVAYARAAAEKPAADEASVTVAATLAVDGVAVDATIAASSAAPPPGAAEGVEVTATPEVVATADGLQLHLCAKNPTG